MKFVRLSRLYLGFSLFSFWLMLVLSLTFTITYLSLDQDKVLTASGYFYLLSPQQESEANYVLYSQFKAVPASKMVYEEKVSLKDARVIILERYLKKYNSPMRRQAPFLAYKFVEAADKYQLPFTLLPAIAQCESNLGKYSPPNCYNAWGYGIHSRGTLCFSSWSEAIERVARGLSQDYLQEGLVDPEKIMAKYTPLSNGSWARCVRQFTRELEEGVSHFD